MTNTIETEIKSQLANAARPVHFPDVRKLSDLFTDIRVVREYPNPHARRTHTWRLECYGETGEAYLDSFVSVRGAPFSLDVEPRSFLVDWLTKNMMIVDNYVLNFGITIRSGGECALVECHYNQISGSRWLAIVDADEVRKYGEQS